MASQEQLEHLEDWKQKLNRELVNTELEAAQLRVLMGCIDDEIAGIRQWN